MQLYGLLSLNILTNVQPVIDIAKIQIKSVSYISYGENVGRDA